jgi:acetyl-CoA C-acetyltransferase
VTTEAYIYSGIRTPFGRHAGALASVRPDDLLASAIGAALERSAFSSADFEDVIIGCTNQAGEDSRNIARRAALLAGLPVEVAGLTVNRLCASGLAAVIDAGRAVECGHGEVFVAGGVESMSRAPFVMSKSDRAFGRNAQMFDSTLGSRFPNVRQSVLYGDHTMTETADEVGKDLEISREESDQFAHASQLRYVKARASGFFEDELRPVPVVAGKRSSTLVIEDEHPRPDTTMEKLAALDSLLDGGVVTAGNASGINDGAAVLIIGSRQAGERVGVKPLARIVASGVAGVEPRIMGLGPVPASKKALARAGLRLSDMDVIEINEAFATQVLGCLKLMELSSEDSRVNPNGGAIALGHPLGASGARLALTAIRQLHCVKGQYALVTLCIGVGQGLAAVFERTF